MSRSQRLPLDSPLWNDLNTFGVAPQRVPAILTKLVIGPVDPTEPGLNELVFAIFDQYSLAPAAYAVFPYLVAMCERYPNNPKLFYLAANIAASANIEQSGVASEIIDAFMQALVDLETMATARIVKKGQTFDETHGATVAAMAFSGHCAGRLLMDSLDFKTTNHTGLLCPKCGMSMEVMLFQQGLVLMERGHEPQPPEPPKPITEPVIRAFGVRQPNPWQVVDAFIANELRHLRVSPSELLHLETATRVSRAGCGPDIPPEDAFSLIGSIFLAHGHFDSGRRCLRLYDDVACSRCDTVFVAARGWWGCTDSGVRSGNLGRF